MRRAPRDTGASRSRTPARALDGFPSRRGWCKTAARSKTAALEYGWAPRERALVDADFQPDRQIGIGVPANLERHVHVLAEVQLRRHVAEAMADGQRDRAVCAVEGERVGRPVGSRAGVEL